MVTGVMFDFSGTLFRIESTEEWLRGALAAVGGGPDGPEAAGCARRLDELGALPGGRPPREVPAHLAELWRDRDLTADHHRACYTGLMRAAGVADPGLAEALYARSCAPEAWRPYPDAGPTLRELRRRGIPVAVVSNIGWDLRTVFDHHGLAEQVDVFVLSYELGIKKPDAGIFRAACERLGRAPADVLMVGDDRTADAGAAALGCPVHLVEHLPAGERPDALSRILDRC